MFISYRAHQNISQIVQWLKGTSSRLLSRSFLTSRRASIYGRGGISQSRRHNHRRLINEYINEQEREPVHEDDGRFQIDPLEPLAFKARVVQFDLRGCCWHVAVVAMEPFASVGVAHGPAEGV
jgi:hypothetical protein